MWTMGLLVITTYLPLLELLSAFSDFAVFAQAFLVLYDEAEPYDICIARDMHAICVLTATCTPDCTLCLHSQYRYVRRRSQHVYLSYFMTKELG
jgi:hypothetical protein